MKKAIFILILLVILVSACAPAVTPDKTYFEENIRGNVRRFVDDEANVVCWIYSAGYKGGISCLPLGETSLQKIK